MDFSSTSNPQELELRLERFEDRYAILRNEIWGEIRWPIENFPHEIQIGESVTLKLHTQKQTKDEEYERMRRLLEELIN